MKKFSRRQFLIFRYGLISFILIVAATILIVLALPEAQPYKSGEKVEGITSELERQLPKDYPRVTFTDVAIEAGIDFIHFHGIRSTQLPEDMGSGAAWGDYDRDGFPDLYICNLPGPLTLTEEERKKSPAYNHLYHNNGNGTFTDVTKKAGVGFQGWSMGAAWGDYDNDGYLDIFISNYGHNLLYRNNGDGTFEDVTLKTSIGDAEGFWSGVSWADYDLDGDLDLYVCGYVKYISNPEDRQGISGQYQVEVPFTLNPSSYKPERNLLYRNNGKGKFTEVAAYAGVENREGRSLSASWCDFNHDGFPDLYVANDISDNAFYLNLGNGKFSDISESAWVADYRGAMGLAVGDWNNDGDMDIFITHWIAQENALFDNLLNVMGPNQLRFTDIADQEGLGQISLDYIGWGTSFFDYDNDGRRDLFVSNGSTFQEKQDPTRLVPMRALLFWNRGEQGFFEVSAVAGKPFSRKEVGRGAAFADYDNDGDVDVFVVNHGGRPWLLRNNNNNKNSWLNVRAHGNFRNRFGSGVKVEVIAGGHKWIDEIGAQSSYLSQNDLVAHFGLGKLDRVDIIRAIFNKDRIVESRDIKVNQTVVLKEP